VSLGVTFFVPGLPVAQGSMRPVRQGGSGRIVLVSNNRTSLNDWRSNVAHAARAGLPEGFAPSKADMWDVSMTFVFPRPSGHSTPKGALRKSAPLFPSVRPDLDKLVRSVLDALTHVMWDDDARVVAICAAKAYSRADSSVGLTVAASLVPEAKDE
jgi:Holliday junction resolvase RusA-like endonuclease